MGPDFVLRGRARRIARAVVDAMGPRWPDADLDIQDEVLEEVEFRNRFRAQVAKGELLEAVSPWRVIVPAGRMSRGRTQAWLASAPRPTLAWLRDHPQVRIPVTKPRKTKEPRPE